MSVSTQASNKTARRARMIRLALVSAGGAALLGGSMTALAQSTPDGLRDLVGARGAGGERQLEARGYAHVRTETGSDRKWSYWWNARLRQCISVSTYDGRYAAIVDTLPADCGKGEGSGDGGYGGGRDLHLVCFGHGSRPSATTVPILRWDRRHRDLDTDYATVMSRREFDGMVQIDIRGDAGHIWLPKSLVPPIHASSHDGWWELYDLKVGRTEIKGRYRLNGLNKPKLTINRMTGRVKIDGMSKFSGTCEEDYQGEGQRF